MIDLSRIEAVQQRIAAIEKKVGMRHPQLSQKSFEDTLKTEIEKIGTPAEPSSLKKNSSIEAPSTEYNAVIQSAAKKYNVDPRLISAVAETESDFSQAARSSAGAIGVMQLMPDTAAALGVNPYDAKENIDGGAHYLRQMLDTFGGDVKKAIAAYNAGPQAVKDYGGVPPYSETIGYVDKVLDLYR